MKGELAGRERFGSAALQEAKMIEKDKVVKHSGDAKRVQKAIVDLPSPWLQTPHSFHKRVNLPFLALHFWRQLN